MSETVTMTLTEFLLARVAEDEAVALQAEGHESRAYWSDAVQATHLRRPSVEHYQRHDPARVLAECEAKRNLVAGYRDLEPTCDHGPWVRLGGVCQCGVVAHTLQAFAAVYADHADYDEAWRA